MDMNGRLTALTSSYCVLAVLNYDIPGISVNDGRAKLRELFMKNKHITDLRAIDFLVIRVS